MAPRNKKKNQKKQWVVADSQPEPLKEVPDDTETAGDKVSNAPVALEEQKPVEPTVITASEETKEAPKEETETKVEEVKAPEPKVVSPGPPKIRESPKA